MKLDWEVGEVGSGLALGFRCHGVGSLSVEVDLCGNFVGFQDTGWKHGPLTHQQQEMSCWC